MWIRWEQIKTGRQVTAFHFTFGAKQNAEPEPTHTAAHPPKPKRPAPSGGGVRIHGILKGEIERLAYPGESYEQAAERIARERTR